MLEDEIYNENIDDPDDLERVIEGEDNTEGNQLDNSGNETEGDNEGDKNQNDDDDDEEKKKAEPKKKRVVNPQPKLNADRLKGPRGIGILESFFHNVKLKGKGHEKEDLNVVMKHLEHWAHRLYPRFKFDDCLEKIEKLGTKRPIQNYLNRIRLGMEDEEVPRTEEPEESPLSPPVADPFDELIGHRPSQTTSQPIANLNAEQRERMLRNRMIAEERRMARLKTQQEKQRIQNESSEQKTNDSSPVKVSQAESNLLNVSENMHTDEVLTKETDIPTSEDNSLQHTRSCTDGASTDNDTLHGKETEISRISTDDTRTAVIADSNEEESNIAALRERMLQNKRKAEELLKARKKAKLENNTIKETITVVVTNGIQSDDNMELNYNNEQTLLEEMETDVERMNESNEIAVQGLPDTRTVLANNETERKSVDESICNEQTHEETENAKSVNEMIDLNNKQRNEINYEENCINIEKTKELDIESSSEEQKLNKKTHDARYESLEKNINENDGIDCETNYINVTNAEGFEPENNDCLRQETKDIIDEHNKPEEGTNCDTNDIQIESSEELNIDIVNNEQLCTVTKNVSDKKQEEIFNEYIKPVERTDSQVNEINIVNSKELCTDNVNNEETRNTSNKNREKMVDEHVEVGVEANNINILSE